MMFCIFNTCALCGTITFRAPMNSNCDPRAGVWEHTIRNLCFYFSREVKQFEREELFVHCNLALFIILVH
jgi:hypothetical protein